MRSGDTTAELFSEAMANCGLMGTYDRHRRRLGVWSRLIVAVLVLGVLFAPYLVGTRAAYPSLFWGATAMLAFFGGWACARAVWHYTILRG